MNIGPAACGASTFSAERCTAPPVMRSTRYTEPMPPDPDVPDEGIGPYASVQDGRTRGRGFRRMEIRAIENLHHPLPEIGAIAVSLKHPFAIRGRRALEQMEEVLQPFPILLVVDRIRGGFGSQVENRVGPLVLQSLVLQSLVLRHRHIPFPDLALLRHAPGMALRRGPFMTNAACPAASPA